MSREELRNFTSRFRYQSNALATFNKQQQDEIKKFQTFLSQKPDGFCCICLRVLYPEEKRYRTINNPESLKNCNAWKLTPLMCSRNERYMVCEAHKKTDEAKLPTYVYPGKNLQKLYQQII